ncbi:thialysine N-epsilon-acetyltransferase-like isoform X2 [Stegostoma tigrinum]|uniref:thialysine N-epsilon-acetyltransferase-like isoform X2 n=1 Tax=Stegostoma tigrinum TaxID=3053191 RepID=UPI00287033A1|nr:thialysine N-epsilon-acetyltransferase-like isoform X2 [Stegostoma tigrinum]
MERDCEQMQELAAYEKLADQVAQTTEGLVQDGFTQAPYYKCLVAEVPADQACRGHTLVGYALYFFSYVAWKGRAVYLEDLYVMEELRGQGIGSAFLRVVAEIALQNKCSLLNFVVLSANFPGIDFYQAKGAVDLTKLEGCHLFRFEQEQLAKLAAGKGQNVTAPPSQ